MGSSSLHKFITSMSMFSLVCITLNIKGVNALTFALIFPNAITSPRFTMTMAIGLIRSVLTNVPLEL